MTDRPDKPDPEATQTGEHRMLPVGTVLDGRYELLELVGVGGMGMVYRAQDRRLDLDVALKVLNPERASDRETLARFERELVLARQVSHPNVVRIHDIGQHGDTHFLTMDYVAGRSLKAVLEEEGALPVDRAVAIAADLARGLAAAHDRGVVHRDLKPANVLLDEDGRARVTDFGVARSLATPGPTRPGNILGTPFYLAPEQAKGEPVDGRSDLFALGLVMHEMVSGSLPFSVESFEESLAQRISGRPRPLSESCPGAPSWFQAVVGRCLQRDPQRRYPDAGSLLADLEAGRATLRSASPRRLAALAAGAALVGALAAGAWWYAPYLSSESLAPGPGDGDDPPAVRTVAVLPFTDQTGEPALAWVRTGVAEMLAVALADARALQVADSLRVFRTLEDLGLDSDRLSNNDLRQLSTLLDADRLVSGRVRSTGGALRVEVSLLRARDVAESPGRFNAAVADAAGLLDAVEQLAVDLRAAMQAGEGGEPETAALSANPPAMAAYGEGLERLTQGDSLGAVPALEKAVAADGGFAAAWVRLAEAYQGVGYGDKARDAVERAVAELDRPDGRVGLEARARSAAMAGDTQRALELRRQLVDRFPNDMEARVALGELQGEGGRLEDARETLERVAGRDPNHPRAWFLLGKYSILAGEYRRAVDDYLVRSLVIQNRLGNAQGQADTFNAMGIAYAQLGELEQAGDQYERAATIRREIGDRRGVAATLSNLARIQVLRGDYPGARERISEALEIQREIGDRAGVAYLHNELGILEEEQGNYEAALRHYRDGLRVREDLGNLRALAESYNNVGYAFYLLGEYDNAAVYARQALERYRESGNDEGMMLAQQTLGLLEAARGNWEAALSTALEALGASRELGIHSASAVSLGIIGRVAEYQGRYRAALESFDEALELVEELGDPRGLAEYSLARAGVLLELNMTEEAMAALQAAQRQLEQGGNRAQRAELARLRGLLALSRGEAERAVALLEGAGGEARASGSITSELETGLALGRARLAAGESEEAERLFRELAQRAGAIGHVVLHLEALELTGRAALAGGSPERAREAFERALALARSHQPYGGSWQLHLRYAELLDESEGEPVREQLDAAAQELARVRKNLPDAMGETFDTKPEVMKLDEQIASRSQ